MTGDVRTKFVLSNQDGFFGRTYVLSREKKNYSPVLKLYIIIMIIIMIIIITIIIIIITITTTIIIITTIITKQ